MIGDNIKKIRISRGLTQAQLADRVGVSEKTVSSWEVNRTEPKSALYVPIANVLNCDIGELVDGNKILPDDSLMLKKFHALDAFGQRSVMLILNNEFERCMLDKKESLGA
jgi:transcriptional regulator with XRE-family HTH domain